MTKVAIPSGFLQHDPSDRFEIGWIQYGNISEGSPFNYWQRMDGGAEITQAEDSGFCLRTWRAHYKRPQMRFVAWFDTFDAAVNASWEPQS